MGNAYSALRASKLALDEVKRRLSYMPTGAAGKGPLLCGQGDFEPFQPHG
jgi:hypothetical protein